MAFNAAAFQSVTTSAYAAKFETAIRKRALIISLAFDAPCGCVMFTMRRTHLLSAALSRERSADRRLRRRLWHRRRLGA